MSDRPAPGHDPKKDDLGYGQPPAAGACGPSTDVSANDEREPTMTDSILEPLLGGVEGEEWPRWLGHLPWDVRAYYQGVVRRARAALAAPPQGRETIDDLVAQGRCPECGTLQGIWHKMGCSLDA